MIMCVFEKKNNNKNTESITYTMTLQVGFSIPGFDYFTVISMSTLSHERQPLYSHPEVPCILLGLGYSFFVVDIFGSF